MKYVLVFILLFGLPGAALACDSNQPGPSVGDVVFNNVTPQSAELDQQLQALYGCKYSFAMLFSSNSYESMRLLAGAMPATPADAAGKPITGVVLVGFVLNTDGGPVDPVVIKSQDERLSKIALSDVVELRFQPSKFKGKVVRALGIQVYEFR